MMNIAHTSEPIKENGYLYLDFESNMKNEMYVVGYSFGQETRQIVLHSDLKKAAKTYNMKLRSPSYFVRVLLRTLRTYNLTLVAYSEAELNYVHSLSENINTAFYEEIKYLNLAKAAKNWVKKFRKSEMENFGDFLPTIFARDRSRRKQLNHSLASRMRLTGFNAQHGYAPGKTTTRFNHVIAGLNKRAKFESLTPTQKRKWTMALKHNKFDVDALPILMETIGQDEPSILNLSTKLLFSKSKIIH